MTPKPDTVFLAFYDGFVGYGEFGGIGSGRWGEHEATWQVAPYGMGRGCGRGGKTGHGESLVVDEEADICDPEDS